MREIFGGERNEEKAFVGKYTLMVGRIFDPVCFLFFEEKEVLVEVREKYDGERDEGKAFV